MKRCLALASLCLLAGCATPASVQRIGVGYNNAVANLTDELALLNVVRASQGYTLHYTSLSRLTGSITLKATAGFNAQVKAAAPTDTNAAATTVAPTGTTVVDTITRAVASGGNQYTPSIGGEVDTNPSFDVDVNDTKEFYQGMTAGIDPSLLDDLLRQGYDPQELLALTVSNIDFVLSSDLTELTMKKGERLLFIKNDRGDDETTPAGTAAKTQLTTLFACYTFQTSESKGEPKVLAPLSALAGSNSGAPGRLTLQDLALLDGAKLELDGRVGDAKEAAEPTVVRPGAKKPVGKFLWNELAISQACPLPASDRAHHQEKVYLQAKPPAGRTFVGNNLVFTGLPMKDGQAQYAYVPVDITMIIRSPEAVIQFLGDCLGPTSQALTATCRVGGRVLFELHRGPAPAGEVSAQFKGERYYIASQTAEGRASLRTLGLIEKLIDLHKSSTDKPVTQPVRVVS